MKKTCDYITTANVNRKLVYSANYTVESEFIVELSNDEQFSSPQVLGSHRTREISTTVNTSGYPRVAQILQKDFELDIEESKWVRFKVVDSLFHQSNDWQDEAVITYSQPVLITISPSDDILISSDEGFHFSERVVNVLLPKKTCKAPHPKEYAFKIY